MWPSYPQFKLECSGKTYVNDQALTIELLRPENNISYLIMQVNDYKSSKFVDVFDAFDIVELSLRYQPDSWIKVFSGKVNIAAPHLSVNRGEILEIGAWGEGYALHDTHCNTSYGVESQNSTKKTPKEILDDLVDNYINKSFGGSATGYGITKTKIENVHSSLSVTHLPSQFNDNFMIANRLCDIVTAYAQSLDPAQVGIHWFIDPSKNWYVKKIDADHGDGNWPRYYGGSQKASIIEVAKDLIVYDFRKVVQDYANKILLCSCLRKPGFDYWTNNHSGLWGTSFCTLTDDTTRVVGTHSLRAEPTQLDEDPYFWYPSGENTGWDIDKIGSEKTIPTVSLYGRRNQDLGAGAGSSLRLFTTDHDSDYFYVQGLNDYITETDEFFHLSFPIGHYYDLLDESRRFRWLESGSPDWSDINGIAFMFTTAVGPPYLYIDDLHIAGKVIREAYSSADISAKGLEKQKVLRNDVAVDDTIKASDDSGTAGRLAYAELLRRMQTPIAAIIQIPMLPALLPGQTVHIHACKKADDLSFRIDQDFRVKELRHIINVNQGFRTILNLTSDITNSHAFAAPSRFSLLKEYAGMLGHAEARDLKGSGIDLLIPTLSKDY